MKNKIVFHPKTLPTPLFNVFSILVIDFKRKNVQSQINLFKKHTIRPICIRGRPQNQAFFLQRCHRLSTVVPSNKPLHSTAMQHHQHSYTFELTLFLPNSMSTFSHSPPH